MAPKRTNKQKIITEQKQRVDNVARYLQIVAIVGVVVIIIIGQVVQTANPVPIWVTAGLMGVAIGLSPEQFIAIIKDFFKGHR